MNKMNFLNKEGLPSFSLNCVIEPTEMIAVCDPMECVEETCYFSVVEDYNTHIAGYSLILGDMLFRHSVDICGERYSIIDVSSPPNISYEDTVDKTIKRYVTLTLTKD